jgi:phosphomevalonate kinase
MKARAPGKVVISGAYAVLHGAPALVTAVDRYVTADSAEAADFVTPEVRAGMGAPFPAFDASDLRDAGRKLGLGSSAAILVACLVAGAYPNLGEEAAARHELFHRALTAHRKAQGGGSGIDVAASVFGGTLEYQLTPLEPQPVRVVARSLPTLCFQLWACDRAASTSEFLARVAALEAENGARHAAIMQPLITAAVSARDACVAHDPSRFLSALSRQATGLAELGSAAGIPIFVPELLELAEAARSEGAVVLPAGAGGGDIALFVGQTDPSPALLAACSRLAHRPLAVRFSAAGASTLPV